MNKRIYILLSFLFSFSYFYAQDSISSDVVQNSLDSTQVKEKKKAVDDLYVLKQEADSAFAKEEYEQAVNLYSKIAKQTESADICYNLV